jgi:hypothetical protein
MGANDTGLQMLTFYKPLLLMLFGQTRNACQNQPPIIGEVARFRIGDGGVNCKIRGILRTNTCFLKKEVIMLRSECRDRCGQHLRLRLYMGMGKPDVCRTTELALPIPASVQKKKRSGFTGLLDYYDEMCGNNRYDMS